MRHFFITIFKINSELFKKEAFGFAMANNPNPTPPPSSGAGEIPGELGALNETIGASSVAPSSIAPGEPGNNPHPQRKG